MDFFELEDDAHRRLVAAAMLEISGILLDGEFDLDHVRIANCLTIARIDKELLSISELAKRARVPRPTVIRKIRAWEEMGMVTTQKSNGLTFVMPSVAGATSASASAFWRDIGAIFQRTAERLSDGARDRHADGQAHASDRDGADGGGHLR